MDTLRYIVISREEGLYDRVSRQISTHDPNSEIVKADTLQEGVALLRQSGAGILVTDLSNVGAELPPGADFVRFPDSFRVGFTSSLTADPRETAAGQRETGKNDRKTESGPQAALETWEVEKADLRTVKQYVRLHLEEELTLPKLSEMVCLSPNYLSTLFKRREGLALKKFIEKNRIERAAYLLLTEDSMMSEIAARVGYHHCSYFCRIFRRYYGVTPLQFRLKNRSDKKAKKLGGQRRKPDVEALDPSDQS